ncbi:hypothetical protein ONZ45_g2487 [Pleurotus djamor]|nr:hypothetical protein ONZ45_g2487 [Pleurotus djamor]
MGDDDADDTGSPLTGPQLVWVFDGLLVSGLIQLVAVFLTALLSKRVRRFASWYIFIASWIVHSISFLFIAGRQATSRPSAEVCLAQTAMIYASPALTAYATLILILQLYVSVSPDLTCEDIRQTMEYFRIMYTKLFMLPPMVFFLVVFEVMAIAMHIQGDDIERDLTGMICHMRPPLVATTNTVVIGIGTLAIVYLEVYTIRALKQRALKYSLKTDIIAKSMTIRLILFNVAPCCVLIYEIVNIPLSDDKIPISFCHIAYASR